MKYIVYYVNNMLIKILLILNNLKIVSKSFLKINKSNKLISLLNLSFVKNNKLIFNNLDKYLNL
jgi:hypothetical protein